uniref:Uncharacterized protein n=1 Tax=Panstrongylus lignarius TaxID=156445 RepID=A0A224Y2G5_9HEMI
MKITLLFIWLGIRGRPFIRNFFILFEISKKVDKKSVILIQFIVIGCVHCIYSTLGPAIFYKYIPFCLPIFIFRIIFINNISELVEYF